MTSFIIIIIIVLILLVVLYKTNVAENTHITKYISFISGISTVIIIMSFVFTIYQYQKSQKDKEYSEFISDTEKNWIDLEKMFFSNYPYLANLYRELNMPSQSVLPEPPQLSDSDKIQQQYKENYACQILFQIIENIINTKEIPKDYGWNVIFINWGNSPTFRKVWSVSRSMYNPTTQSFIDNLVANKFSSPKDISQFLSISRKKH